VAGALSSATSVNYAAKKASAAGAVTVSDCATSVNALVGAAMPTGFTLGAGTACTAADGGTATCPVTNTQTSQVASATVVCVP